MSFINPKIDFAFKKIFGSPESKDILISFLNAILYEEQPIIQDVEILDPYLVPQIKGIKNTYLDIKARITGDKTVIIEMQVLNVESFEKRILYSAAKAYSIQLDQGEQYKLLNPVIAVTITDFKMFEDSTEVISKFALKEKKRLIDYPIDDLELVFIELPKFIKSLDEVETLTDKWLYFLKGASALESVPSTFSNVTEIQKAFQIANKANLTRAELEDLEKRAIFIQDQRGAIERATRIGREQGLQKGLEQGLQQGKQELVLRLLTRKFGEIPPEIETQIQQLSAEKLEDLGIAVLEFINLANLSAWLQMNGVE